MEPITSNISDLKPEQRDAAERFLGQSLANFQKVAIRVVDGGNAIVIRFFGGKQNGTANSNTGKWDIPACFNVLTDLSDEERAEYDTVVSEAVKLSRPI